jgi:hypothetical protein
MPVGVEVLTEVVMIVAIFWDIAPYSLYANQCFGGMYNLHHQGKKSFDQKPACSRWLGNKLGSQDTSYIKCGYPGILASWLIA